MLRAGVPVILGRKECQGIDEAKKLAREIGYPVIIASAGGGGAHEGRITTTNWRTPSPLQRQRPKLPL